MIMFLRNLVPICFHFSYEQALYAKVTTSMSGSILISFKAAAKTILRAWFSKEAELCIEEVGTKKAAEVSWSRRIRWAFKREATRRFPVGQALFQLD